MAGRPRTGESIEPTSKNRSLPAPHRHLAWRRPNADPTAQDYLKLFRSGNASFRLTGYLTVYPPSSVKHCPRHEARRVRSQVGGGLADLLQLAGARDGVHGAARAHGRLRVRLLGGDRARQLGLDEAGRDGVHAHVPILPSAMSSAIARTIPIMPALAPQ